VYKIPFKHAIILYFGTAGTGIRKGRLSRVKSRYTKTSSKQDLVVYGGRDDVNINRQINYLYNYHILGCLWAPQRSAFGGGVQVPWGPGYGDMVVNR